MLSFEGDVIRKWKGGKGLPGRTHEPRSWKQTDTLSPWQPGLGLHLSPSLTSLWRLQ